MFGSQIKQMSNLKNLKKLWVAKINFFNVGTQYYSKLVRIVQFEIVQIYSIYLLYM